MSTNDNSVVANDHADQYGEQVNEFDNILPKRKHEDNEDIMSTPRAFKRARLDEILAGDQAPEFLEISELVAPATSTGEPLAPNTNISAKRFAEDDITEDERPHQRARLDEDLGNEQAPTNPQVDEEPQTIENTSGESTEIATAPEVSFVQTSQDSSSDNDFEEAAEHHDEHDESKSDDNREFHVESHDSHPETERSSEILQSTEKKAQSQVIMLETKLEGIITEFDESKLIHKTELEQYEKEIAGYKTEVIDYKNEIADYKTELEKYKTELEETESTLDSNAKKAEDEQRTLADTNKKLMAEIKKLTAENKKLTTKLGKQDESLATSKSKQKEAAEAKKALSEEFERQTVEFAKQTKELEELRVSSIHDRDAADLTEFLTAAYEPPSTVVREYWLDLDGAIRTLGDQMANFANGKLRTIAELRKKAPDFCTLADGICATWPTIFVRRMDRDDQAFEFLRAVIWRFVSISLLQNPWDQWGKVKSKTINDFINKSDMSNDDAIRKAHWCRGMIGQLHVSSPHMKPQPQYRKTAVVGLKKLLRPLRDEELDTKWQAVVDELVDEVVDTAIKISTIFVQSKARWEVLEPPHGVDKMEGMMQYDEMWMGKTNHNETKKKGVELIIKPGLARYGGRYGDKYHERIMVSRACVMADKSVPWPRNWTG